MKRYKLKTPYEVKGSYDLGLLYPIGCLEVLQGQTTRLDTRVLLRAQPMMAPAYEKMNVRVVHAYVPFRILWDQWDDFIQGKTTKRVPWYLYDTVRSKKGLLDYFGFQTSGQDLSSGINALPLMAYYKIWNDHFRDPDLQKEISLKLVQGSGIFQSFDNMFAPSEAAFSDTLPLMRVNWRKDRFTSALTAAQASPEVNVPISNSGPLMLGSKTNPPSPLQRTGGSVGGSWGNIVADPARTPSASNLYYRDGLQLGVSELKTAMAMYNYKMNEARFSDDYDGYRAKYGLKPIDARLQKSEIIGGFGDIISVSDVLGTGDQNLGEQGGNALGYTRGKRAYKHYAPEHGVIITLMYIRPKASYCQGVARKFLKFSHLDYFQAEFKDLGYQPIYNTELLPQSFSDNSALQDFSVFGYEPRYNEYRSEPSIVCGELKPGQPLSHWAAPRTWSSKPVLNSSFLECRPAMGIWASANTDKFIGYIQHNVSKLSFVPPYSDPKFKL